ncbi:Sgd1p NDAI_0J01620 [Naumovozyma dairenensis CBS 421]|uniref:MI domain-containing protein n=1 Tax=Naumovozyma dairenensis (strain ATCC 10597 / BCRC 20456 / CBS 421 / NBRC 0211 / NRRL Y-12639) TaxID=1071378 RepID=G0WGX6_NAUDC|nr:hypothetical protein NDAI_0J01620 [Naumovozyma dairenensis CBS 421]CCD27054.1 hypothetical protein NDAI_0J01620 [Naumovozyma dairenensis CBS 421]
MLTPQNGINIPGIILDELKTKDYSKDERFQSIGKKKRNAGKQLSRKEKRKQLRAEKKHKHISSHNQTKEEHNKPLIHKKITTMADTKSSKHYDNNKEPKQKKAKTSNAKTITTKLPFSSDDELSSGDFDEFDEDDLDAEEWEQLKELEENDSNEDESEGQDDDVEEELDETEPMTTEETMAKLKALKESKNKKKNTKTVTKTVTFDLPEEDKEAKEMTVEETMAELKRKKAAKKERKSNRHYEEEAVEYPLTPEEMAAIERDELDMKYYAKKLGLKSTKKKIRARDEFDAIGGLLEGLDYFENYGEEDEDYGDFAFGKSADRSQEEADDSKQSENESSESENEDDTKAFPSDDELSSGDFDEFEEGDLDEEEWEQLRELEGADSSDTETKSLKKKKKAKENPYVAPATSDSTDTYIPPSLRKKQLTSDGKSPKVLEIKQKVKSSLNKLSDSNITIIILSINELYDSYPRQYVTEAITNQIIEIIAQKNKLLDSFIMNYSAVAFALWKLRGIEMGAHFIQTVVETFLKSYKTQLSMLDTQKDDNEPTVLPKECNNIVTLLAYSYNFGFISCRLIYDLVRMFVEDPNEFTTELLLRIVAVSGQLIRGDDPSALKEILSILLKNVKPMKQQSPRLKFLLDTMSDLKNNRLKPSILATDHHLVKKMISNLVNSSSSNDALQVSLDDIRNVDMKGKWWLVGASWRGNMEHAFDEAKTERNSKQDNIKPATEIDIGDDLLDDIPDWAEIARKQRMNTDIRRAIFISIMSATDYMEAFSKLEKLNLKNKQTLEIPRVLMHCLLAEGGNSGYNPFYSLVACKICEHHQLLKSFQFLFWNVVKKFEDKSNGGYGSDDSSDEDTEEEFDGDEDKRLRNISNQGRFFGYLISEGILKLDTFKHVPIMGGLNSNGTLFVELLLYQLLLSIAKKSENKEKNKIDGKRKFNYKDTYLINTLTNGIKLENRSAILKGLKWFIQNKLKYKSYISGSAGSKPYERDLRRIKWASKRFVELIDEELEGVDY